MLRLVSLSKHETKFFFSTCQGGICFWWISEPSHIYIYMYMFLVQNIQCFVQKIDLETGQDSNLPKVSSIVRLKFFEVSQDLKMTKQIKHIILGDLDVCLSWFGLLFFNAIIIIHAQITGIFHIISNDYFWENWKMRAAGSGNPSNIDKKLYIMYIYMYIYIYAAPVTQMTLVLIGRP